MKQKKLVNFSINSEIADQFKVLAEEKAINRSKLIEILIVKWVKENEDTN